MFFFFNAYCTYLLVYECLCECTVYTGVCVCVFVQETAKNRIIIIGLALPSAGTPLSRDWRLVVRGGRFGG